MRRGCWVLLVGAVLVVGGCVAQQDQGSVMVQVRAGEYSGGQDGLVVQVTDADGDTFEETAVAGESVVFEDVPAGEVLISIEGMCDLSTELAGGEQLDVFIGPDSCEI